MSFEGGIFMEQEKIGKFIAKRRKDLHFTQANLAKKLGITDRAVSKWENGKSIPDASLMLDLCQLLEINVNELLTGEQIVMKDYKKIAEQNLICISAVVLILMGTLLTKISQFLGIMVVILGTILIFVTAIYAVMIEHDAGYYECPNCKMRYIPTRKAVLLAPHYGTTRKMECPYCGKKGYHKKVFTK